MFGALASSFLGGGGSGVLGSGGAGPATSSTGPVESTFGAVNFKTGNQTPAWLLPVVIVVALVAVVFLVFRKK